MGKGTVAAEFEKRVIMAVESGGGKMESTRRGEVTVRLAVILGTTRAYASLAIHQLEEKGVLRVNRGEGGMYIYGVQLVEQEREKIRPISQGGTVTQGAGVDYRKLADELLLRVATYIDDENRKDERIKHLEDRVTQLQRQLDEERPDPAYIRDESKMDALNRTVLGIVKNGG